MNKPYNIVLKNPLGPIGGPSGYLHNLDISLKESNIELINIISTDATENRSKKKKKRLKSILNPIKLKLTPSSLRYKRIVKREKKAYVDFYDSIQNQLSNSKLNHFHITNDFYYYKTTQPEDTAISVLMSHSPEPRHKEMLKLLQDSGNSKSTTSKLYNHQKMIDIYAFKNADYIIFPCKEAASPYDRFFDENSIDRSKFRYIITSSRPISFSTPKDEFRSTNNISKDSIVLAYIGRRTEIKGYNIFCQAALQLCNDKRFVFLSAGSGAIKTPKSENIIDFGWTDDPGTLLNACDYLVVPNKNTYFDLGIIQALSLNKPVITTPTGGNRWFSDKNINIHYVDYDSKKLAEKIKQLKPVHDNLNRDFFEKNLDNKHFAKNYLNLYKTIVNENMER